MRCPQCTRQMQPYRVRELRLERCGDCGKVWLELDEVSRLFGAVNPELTVVELDQLCPNEHGPLVKATLRGREAAICAVCRGALLGTLLTHQLAPPAPKAARQPVQARCEVCGAWAHVSELTQTVRGSCCLKCALVESPKSRGGDDWRAASDVAELLLNLVIVLFG